MDIPSAAVNRYVYFVAVDATDETTRETGLSSFTVYRSRNGAADVAMTTPTITEIDASTMPGVYALLVDEDTTPTQSTEELCLHITHAGMKPVTRTVQLFDPPATDSEIATAVGALTLAEPSAIPAWTTGTLAEFIAWLASINGRNKKTEVESPANTVTETVRNDADSADLYSRTVVYNGSDTVTKNEFS